MIALLLIEGKSAFINNVKILNMTFEGLGSEINMNYDCKKKLECISIRNGSLCILENLKVINSTRNSIHLDGCRKCLVISCIVMDSGGSAIHLSRSKKFGGTTLSGVLFSKVMNSGFEFAKGAITQNKLCKSNLYICNAVDCNYQKFRFLGSSAISIMNENRLQGAIKNEVIGISLIFNDHNKVELFLCFARSIFKYYLVKIKCKFRHFKEMVKG